IGVGGRGKAPFLVDSLFGKRVVYEDVQIDEAALQQIAARTGGAYYRAEDAGALKRIYEAIDGLERSKLRLREAFTAEELFPSLVTPALILLLVETLLLATLLRKVP
ncbi:MAG: aerotolerance regulator BatA, partial [Myxococcota bacterium]